MQYIGTICEVSGNKSLVRVEYLGTKTKLIPYVQNANSFKRTFSPPRVGGAGNRPSTKRRRA
nr:MAG TPA: baseplate assembly protein [Caudoviricetes sp.]